MTRKLIIKFLAITVCLSLAFLSDVIGQTKKKKPVVVNKNGTVKTKKAAIIKKVKQYDVSLPESDEKIAEKAIEDATYISPFRYVIVRETRSSDDADNNQMEILVRNEDFNEENLRNLFSLIKRRFKFKKTLPVLIVVHTSITTLETPEEKDLSSFSDGGRLDDEVFKHNRAHYVRQPSGNEWFNYTVSLNPYQEKSVLLNGQFPMNKSQSSKPIGGAK